MKLTRLQYKALQTYWRYHSVGLTLAKIAQACWRRWLLLVVFGILAYLFFVPRFPAIGWLYVGVFSGALLRDVAYLRISFGFWPVIQQITDWKQVSDLIEAHEKGAA